MRLSLAVTLAAALVLATTSAAAIKPYDGTYIGKAGSLPVSLSYKAGKISKLKVGPTLVAATLKVVGGKFTARKGTLVITGKWTTPLTVEGTVKKGAAKALPYQASWGP